MVETKQRRLPPHALAKLLSDVFCTVARPAIVRDQWKDVQRGTSLAWQREDFAAFNKSCRLGIGSATRHLSAVSCVEVPASLALERVQRAVSALLSSTRHRPQTERQRTLALVEFVNETEPKLALWLFGMAACQLISLVPSSDRPSALAVMDHTLDWIAGVPDRSSAPIVILSVNSPSSRIASSVVQAMLHGRDRVEFITRAIDDWRERFAAAWSSAHAERFDTGSGAVSMRAAGYRRMSDAQAFSKWVIDIMLDGILGYPARC